MYEYSTVYVEGSTCLESKFDVKTHLNVLSGHLVGGGGGMLTVGLSDMY